MTPPALRRIRRSMVAAFGLLLIVGCAQPAGESQPRPGDSDDKSKAFTALEDIKPVPEFPDAEPQPATEPVPQAQRYLETGRQRFDEGLWADAAAALEKALQIDPNLSDARIMLARTSLQQGDVGLARTQLEEVAKSHPRDPAVYQLLGEIAVQQRRFTEAIAALRLALRAMADEPRRPERILAHLSLALALREEGYLAAASDQLHAFLDAIAAPTAEMDAHRELHEIIILYRAKAPALLGEIESELGRHDRAVAALRTAVAANSNDASLQRGLILELAQAGMADEAFNRIEAMVKGESDAAKAIELLKEICDLSNRAGEFEDRLVSLAGQTGDDATKLQIARVLLHQDRSAQASKVLLAITAKSPDHTEALALLADITARLGDWKETIRLLARLIRADVGADRRIQKIIDQSAADDALEALAAAAKSHAGDNTDDPAARYVYASTLLAAGNTEAAMAECAAALRADPDFAPALILDARIALRKHNWQEALDKVSKANDRDINHPSLHQIEGDAHVALGDPDKADAAYLEAFRLDREDPEPLFRLAEVMERRGELARAEQLYRRILDDVDPRYMPAREQLIRIWLNTRKTRQARDYFADFEKLGQKGAAVERCRALVRLAESKAPAGKQRLEEYREDLRKIISGYPDESATHLALAMTHEAAGEFEQALKEVSAALALDPDDLGSLERKADYETKLLDYDAAVATLKILLELRPNDAGYTQRLARLALAQGDLDTAAAQFSTQLKRADTTEARAPLISQLVTVYRLAERHDEGVKLAKDWLSEDPTDLGRRVLYLSALRGAEKNEKAINAARKWLDKDPTSSELRRIYISQLSSAERYLEAQQRVLAWLAADPDDFDLNDLLIRLFWQTRDWDSAIEAAHTGIEQPRMEEAYAILLGRSYRLARRFEDAAELYRRQAARMRRSIDEFPLIQTLIEAQRYQEAEKEAIAILNRNLNEQAIDQGYDPRTVLGVRQLLSRIYQLTDRPSQANQQLEEILALTPTDPGINNDLGYTWAEQGIKLDRAERMIRFALGEEPLNGAFLDSLGWVCYKKGDFADAVKYIRRAILLAAAEDAVLHDHLADALYRLGKTDEAKENWEKSLELTGPEENFFPSPDDEELRTRVQKKLADLADGKTVETAPLARPESSTQPAEDP